MNNLELDELREEWKNLPKLDIPVYYYVPCMICEQKGFDLCELWTKYGNDAYLVDAYIEKCSICEGLGWIFKKECIKVIKA